MSSQRSPAVKREGSGATAGAGGTVDRPAIADSSTSSGKRLLSLGSVQPQSRLNAAECHFSAADVIIVHCASEACIRVSYKLTQRAQAWQCCSTVVTADMLIEA